MPVVVLASASFWWDQFINGLTTGSLYALIALGYTMVYGVLKMINFAHGEVFMLGSFAGYYAITKTGGDDATGVVVAGVILIAMIGAIVVSVGTSLALERLAYRPLRNAPRLAPLISAIGASIFLQYLVLDRTDAGVRIYPSIFPDGSIGGGTFELQYIQMFLIGSSVAMMLLLYAIVQLTSTGRAIRAVAENPNNAALMGVDVTRTIMIVFALGAAMAAVAGVLWGLFFNTIRGSMGFLPGIKAFTAAVLGGIGSIPGAVLGGYILGLAETIGREALNEIPGVDLGNQWRDVIAFTLLVVILLFRPTGILGERVSSRA